MKQKLINIIFGIFTLMMFCTPLIFSKNTSELYEFPKMYFIYFTGATLIFLFLVKLIFFGAREVKRPDFFVTLYLISIVVSTVFSTHLYTSLWGYFSRFNGGLVSYLIFFGVYFAGINTLSAKGVSRLKEVMLLTLLPVGLYALFQTFSVSRVFATFGQPNWLAAYILFLLPLVVQKVQSGEKRMRFFWIMVLAISFAGLWFTASLSGYLGLLVVGLTLFVSKENVKYILVLALMIMVLALANYTFVKNRVSDAFTFSKDSSSYTVSDPGLIRLGLWRGTLQMIMSGSKVFFIGSGPETFAYEYPFYRDDILNYSSEWAFILNKPHNYFLEIWAESGIISLILYLVIFLRFLWAKNKYLVAGMVGFYVTNFFGWPTVSTSLLFWMWLVFARIEN